MKNLDQLRQIIGENWEKYGNLSWAVLGLTSEAGELADCLIKKDFYNKPHQDWEGELGDCLHYILAIAYLRGISLESIVDNNINKLKRRYPSGWTPDVERK